MLLRIILKTWKRLQNYNMYDYQQTNKQQIVQSVCQKVQTSSYIYQNTRTNICKLIPKQKIEKWRKTRKVMNNEQNQQKYEPLIYLENDQNHFKIYNYCGDKSSSQSESQKQRNEKKSLAILKNQQNNQQIHSQDLFIVCPYISQEDSKKRLAQRYKVNSSQIVNLNESEKSQTTSPSKIKNARQQQQQSSISFPIEQYFQIYQGDTIKIGKLKLKVYKVVMSKNKSRMHYEDDGIGINDRNAFQSRIINKIQLSDQNAIDVSDQQQAESCRYCLSKTVTKNNPLINLCKCEGSSKFTHARCLSKWVKQRCNLYINQQSSVAFGSMKGFFCQICKSQISSQKLMPYFFEEQSQNFKEYAILKIMSKPIETIYFLNLSHNDKTYFTMGRQNQNDIIISDLSASRKHCIIQLDKKSRKMYLYDLNSKFGTLVRMTKDRNDLSAPINNRKNLKFQKGRTMFQIEKKKKIGFFRNVFCSPTEEIPNQGKKRQR